MQKEEMIKLVMRQLDAYNRRDIQSFCACYHPEVTVNFLLSGKLDCKGIKAFEEGYRKLFESSPSLHCELKSRIVLDKGSVIDEELVTGLSGFPNGLHAVAIYGFRDGLIDRVWFA